MRLSSSRPVLTGHPARNAIWASPVASMMVFAVNALNPLWSWAMRYLIRASSCTSLWMATTVVKRAAVMPLSWIKVSSSRFKASLSQGMPAAILGYQPYGLLSTSMVEGSTALPLAIRESVISSKIPPTSRTMLLVFSSHRLPPKRWETAALVMVPPKHPFSSMSATDKPARDDWSAAAIPDGPPPQTTTSKESIRSISVLKLIFIRAFR